MEFCFIATYKSPTVQYWCESKVGGKEKEGPGVLNLREEDYVHIYSLSSKTLSWGKGETDKSIPQKQLKIPCQIFDWDDRSQESFMVLTGIQPRKDTAPKCPLVSHNAYYAWIFNQKPGDNI